MITARFEGGPYDGTELGLAGGLPAFMMLIDPPAGSGLLVPMVVGAGFDDHWPGQQRYDLDEERSTWLVDYGVTISGEAVYRHAGAP